MRDLEQVNVTIKNPKGTLLIQNCNVNDKCTYFQISYQETQFYLICIAIHQREFKSRLIHCTSNAQYNFKSKKRVKIFMYMMWCMCIEFLWPPMKPTLPFFDEFPAGLPGSQGSGCRINICFNSC